jgi:hypothetical protein
MNGEDGAFSPAERVPGGTSTLSRGAEGRLAFIVVKARATEEAASFSHDLTTGDCAPRPSRPRG